MESNVLIGIIGILITLGSFIVAILQLKRTAPREGSQTQQQKLNTRTIVLIVFLIVGILYFLSNFVLNLKSVIHFSKGETDSKDTCEVKSINHDSVNQIEPLLVFAGGGSVANMIKDITKGYVDIKNYNSNSIYLDLPSTNAWSLLAEEVIINHTSDSITKKFYPVCLSAIEANDSVFHKMVSFDDFTEKGTVISYYLGEDILHVYTNNKDIRIRENKISISELSKKVKEWCTNKTVDVYITQEGSGTYLTYQNLLKDTVLLGKDAFDIDNYKGTLKWYNTKTKHRTLTKNNREFILLTCGYYTPEDIKGKYEPTVVMKNENKKDVPLTKSMYLYFAGYRNEEDYIKIPNEMVMLLKELKKMKADLISINKNKMYQFKADIITPLDTLIIWDERYYH